MAFNMEAHSRIILSVTLILSHLSYMSAYTKLSVSNMTELYMNYPSDDNYPTAMYYAVEYGTALLATDSDVGANIFYFQPSQVTDKTNIENSLTHLGGKTESDGYVAGGAANMTFTHISSSSLLNGNTMILAEKNCIRRINFNSAEDSLDRIGDCDDGNFTDDGFGPDMRLQDIKRVTLDSDNLLYVLCGSDGNGTGGLIRLDMAGVDPPRILALHDAIALSDDFSSGTPAVKDMATDSSFSTLYVLVNDGGLVAYDISDIPNSGYIQPLYRISQPGGDPGANFTMDDVIYDNATIIVRPYNRQLLIQNYGNSDKTENKLVSLDLDVVSNLDSGRSIPRYAVSTLCAGGDTFIPGSSMDCTVDAELSLRPVMDIDNSTGSLMMSITSSSNISFFIYHFEESEEELPETTTPELTTTTTTTTASTTTTTETTTETTTDTTTTTIPTFSTSPTSTTTTDSNNATSLSTQTLIAESTLSQIENTSSPLSSTNQSTSTSADVNSTAQELTTDGLQTEFICLYCLSGDCLNENTTDTKICSHGCYSRSERMINDTQKSIEVFKGCAEDVRASPDEKKCSDITTDGSCRYYKIDGVEVEHCVRCCQDDSCNLWMQHKQHTPNSSATLRFSTLLLLLHLFFYFVKSVYGII